MSTEVGTNDKNSATVVFHFFSELHGRRLFTPAGAKIGRVDDLVFAQKEPYPEALGILVEHGVGQPSRLIPWTHVRNIGASAVEISPPDVGGEFAPFVDQPGWILLDKHLMGRTVLDIEGRRVEVVNDVHLLESKGRMVIVHVDTSFNGFLRRWGLGERHWVRERLISWKHVQPLNVEDAVLTDTVSLSLKREELADLPSEDLADALEELSGAEQQALFSALDADKAADTLLDAEPRAQRQLIASMRRERAGAILSELSVAQLADLFSVLPFDSVSNLLELVPKENAQRVTEILGEEDVSAGALLSSAFLAMNQDRKVGDALSEIRTASVEMQALSYIYVVDGGRRLVGIVDLRELVRAPDEATLQDIMISPVVSAEDKDLRNAIRPLFAKYGFRMLPVVDADDNILGVIRFKEVMRARSKRGAEVLKFHPTS